MPDSIQFVPPFSLRDHVLERWYGDQIYDTGMTVLMGFLVAAVCGWIGCYLILQGMALLGDAISHTVLLGIVLVFLLGGSAGGAAMFLGAAATGLVTTVLVEALHSTSRIKEDAAIGIVFTTLFALGVALLGIFASRAHIDTGHVLYGNLEFVANSPAYRLGRFKVAVPVAQMALVAAFVAALILLFYKELLVVSFDSQLAASLGLRPRVVRYAMMAVLSIAVVGSFKSVGAILVVAMLIAPAATAYLLTRRLAVMFLLSACHGALSSLVGYHIAFWLEVSTAGAMVSVACGLFSLAFLFSPEQGLVAAAVRRLRLRLRMHQENIVRHLLKVGAITGGSPVSVGRLPTTLAVSRLSVAWAVAALKRRAWIESVTGMPEGLQLTARGRIQAERLDRAHRLWETYLVEQVGLASDHVHPTAEEVEHLLSEKFVETVDDALGHPSADPHGSPIPRSPIADWSPGVFSLSKLRVGDRAQIVGLTESTSGLAAALTEPDRSAREVVGLGLTLGQILTVENHATQPPVWKVTLADGQTRDVPHRLADQILVQVIGVPPS
jgi:ABC-type Mn2+/Zn2+ transport system permease subunit/Mn-dependent DtxR family transcriptional regulator